MFLLSAFYYFIRDPFIVFCGLTLLVSPDHPLSIWGEICDSPAKAVLGFSILIFSKAFIDYSSSGLENPLTHLLILIFLSVFLEKDHSLKTGFWLFFISSLVAFIEWILF